MGGVTLDEAGLIDDLVQRLSKTLLVAFRPAKLTVEQKEMAENIVDKTFGNASWLEKK